MRLFASIGLLRRLDEAAALGRAARRLKVVRRSASAASRPGPALGGREKYRFYVTRVPGPSVCIYNVPNGRTLAPDTGCVQNKQRFATSSRWWPPASLQSAKSAAGAPWAVRGSHLSRLVSLPPLCICCTARLPHINTVDEQRLAALRLDQSKVSCLFVVFCGGSRTPV